MTEQEISVTKPEKNLTAFDNTTVLESQIDTSLLNRIEELEKESKNIKVTAEAAQSAADTANSSADTATQVANAAQANAQESINSTNSTIESLQNSTAQSIEALQQEQSANLESANTYTDDELNAYKKKVASKINLEDTLTLGVTSNAKVEVGDNIKFMQGNAEVAKIDDGKMQIQEVDISEMQIGSIRFHVRSDGGMSITGGGS